MQSPSAPEANQDEPSIAISMVKTKKLSPSEQRKMTDRLFKTTPKAPKETTPEWQKTYPKMQAQQSQDLVDRLFAKSIQQKQTKLEQNIKKYYPVKDSEAKLTQEQVSENVKRLTESEREKRQKQAEALQKKYLPEEPPKKLPVETIDDNVKRLYSDSTKQHEEKQKKLEEKYAFKPEKVCKKVTTAELQEYITKFAQPKRSDFSEHPMWGGTHGM